MQLVNTLFIALFFSFLALYASQLVGISCATKLAISKSPSDYCMTPILEKNFKKRSKDEHQQVKVARDISTLVLHRTYPFEQTQDMRNLLEHFLAKNPFFTHFSSHCTLWQTHKNCLVLTFEIAEKCIILLFT